MAQEKEFDYSKISKLVDVFTEGFSLKKRSVQAFTSTIDPYIEILTYLFPKMQPFLKTIYDHQQVKDRFKVMIDFLQKKILGWQINVDIDGILNKKYSEISKILYSFRQIATCLFDTPYYKQKIKKERQGKRGNKTVDLNSSSKSDGHISQRESERSSKERQKKQKREQNARKQKSANHKKQTKNSQTKQRQLNQNQQKQVEKANILSQNNRNQNSRNKHITSKKIKINKKDNRNKNNQKQTKKMIKKSVMNKTTRDYTNPILQKTERQLQFAIQQQRKLLKRSQVQKELIEQGLQKSLKKLNNKSRQLANRCQVQINNIKQAFQTQKCIHQKQMLHLYHSKKYLVSKLQKQKAIDDQRISKQFKKQIEQKSQNRMLSLQHRFEQEMSLMKEEIMQQRKIIKGKIVSQRFTTSMMENIFKNRVKQYENQMKNKIQQQKKKIRFMSQQNSLLEDKIRNVYKRY